MIIISLSDFRVSQWPSPSPVFFPWPNFGRGRSLEVLRAIYTHYLRIILRRLESWPPDRRWPLPAGQLPPPDSPLDSGPRARRPPISHRRARPRVHRYRNINR